MKRHATSPSGPYANFWIFPRKLQLANIPTFGVLALTYLFDFGLPWRCKMHRIPVVPVPAGRFLINLPETADISWGRQGYNYAGPFINSFPAKSPEIVKEIVDRRTQLLQLPHDMGGIQIIKSTRGKRPYVWFIFSWENTETKGRYIDLEGFFWTNNQGFATKVSSTPDPADMQARANELENYFHQIQMRAPLESPPEPGFCFRNAYFPGEPTKGSSEHISLHASFPSNPDVFIRFSTGTVGTAMAHSPNLVERFEHTSNRFLNELAGIRLLRLRPRMVGPYPGDEKVERIREGNRTVGYSFLWRCLGQADSAVMPKLELEMVTGHGDPPVNSSLRRRDAMALWDATLDSIRYRIPGAPAKQDP